MDNQLLQIQNRTCRIYGTASAEYLLLQIVDEHDLAGMEREVEAIRRQTAHLFLLAAVQVENWSDDLSPWPAPPVWGKQGFGGRAEASPSVWFPGWLEYEAAHPIQTRRVYLSLGDREEHTKNQTMASVGDNIRALHSALTQRGKDCKLEWNAGGHFKDADLRTAKAFAWVMEGKQ